jgi:septal ring factor EnvC (AmiA/AmiB activator)
MTSDRLSQIETSLRRLDKQLAQKQKTLDTIAPEDKERIRQQIEDLKQDEIQPLAAERRQILATALEQLEISDDEAEVVIAEIVEGVTQLEAQPINPEFAEMLQILREIRDKLNEPGKPAALKLKGMISIFPPFLGLFIEPEIDVENFWQQNFPTFRKLIKAATKK